MGKKIIYCGKCGDEIKYIDDLNVAGIEAFHSDCSKMETNLWSKLSPTYGHLNGIHGTVKTLLLIILFALLLVFTNFKYWYIITAFAALIIASRIHTWFAFERHLVAAPKKDKVSNKISKIVRIEFVDLAKGLLQVFILIILIELFGYLISRIILSLIQT
jgi:hypothetical protein